MPFYIAFQVLKVFLIKICKIQPPDYLFLFVFTTCNIRRYHFCKLLELHSTMSDKKTFVTNFPFLTDSTCCLGFFLVWNPISIFRYCCDSHFPGFGKYIFPQLQTCTALVLSANCTEDSCLSDIVIFNNFLVFNFSFFNLSNNNFLFPG